MDKILAIITLLLCGYFLLRIIRPSGITEAPLIFFCVSTACIIIWGYILSFLNRIGEISSWAIIGVITAISVFIIAIYLKVDLTLFHRYPRLSWTSIKRRYAAQFENYPSYVRLILLLLTLTTLLIGVLNLIFVITIAPHEWDSLTYHLPRMAHYLQQNNLNYFDADYWAQVVHPKNSTLLLLYTFLAFGHNENLLQLVQYFSYWILVFGIYGVSRKIGLDRVQGLFSALVGSLLIDAVVQSTTTQNDLIIAAFFASTTYFLFAFRETRNWKYLWLAAIGIGLAVGTKASSFLVMPSIILISLAVTRTDDKPGIWLKNLSILCVSVIVALCIFAIPSGYVENYYLFGNPIGNRDVSSIHSFVGKPVGYIMRGGTYNILRFGFDFLSLDGLPQINLVNRSQYVLRFVPRQILSFFDVDLESLEATSFSSFDYDRPPQERYWGILGFGLIWIVVFLSLFRIIKHPDFFLLSLAVIIFLISQAYSSPYDASKGRFFSACMIFAVPLIGLTLLVNKPIFRAYLTIVVLLGCVSAVSATILKITPLSSVYPEKLDNKLMFSMDRLEQLTFNNHTYYRPLVTFEFLVPADAKVAIFLYPNTFEYPLYGRYLSRVIMPINSFFRGLQPIPADAQFLLYANGYPCALPQDKYLGEDWYLRKLTNENRDCPLPSNP